MKILIVDDNRQDRELLIYCLQEDFMKDAKFRQAPSLKVAYEYLDRKDIDCVVLDLSIDDSTGEDTFFAIYNKYPEIPIVVMTHSKSRELALKLVKAGAKDYIVKDYADHKELYNRISAAFKKHKEEMEIKKTNDETIKRIDTSRIKMMHAYNSGDSESAQELNIKTTSSIANVSKEMFIKLQEISSNQDKYKTELDVYIHDLNNKTAYLNQQLQEINIGVAKIKAENDTHVKNLYKQIKEIKNININGLPLSAQMSILDHKFKETDTKVKELEKKEQSTREKLSSIADINVDIKEKKKSTINNKTAIILAVITTIGSIIGAYFTYKATIEKPQVMQQR